MNAPTGAITANFALVPAGSSGDASVFVSNSSNLIIDSTGYFAPLAAGGLHLYTVPPCRMLDTRTAYPQPVDGFRYVPITGACNIPVNAFAVVLNATVVPSGSLEYLTLWPYEDAQPLASTLNAVDGTITSNMAILPLADGSLSAFTSTSTTQLIIDVTGYFAP